MSTEKISNEEKGNGVLADVIKSVFLNVNEEISKQEKIVERFNVTKSDSERNLSYEFRDERGRLEGMKMVEKIIQKYFL
jgi:hypothetical protein